MFNRKSVTGVALGAMLFSAAAPTNAEEPGGVSISLNAADNQVGQSSSYFDLEVPSENHEQSISFSIDNDSNEEVVLNVVTLNALTSPNQSVQYLTEEETDNSKLVNDSARIEEYIDAPETITIGPKEEKELEVSVAYDQIKGTVLGALGFIEEDQAEDLEEESFNINHVQSRIIAIQLNEEGFEEEKGMVIHDPFIDIYPSIVYLRIPVEMRSNHLSEVSGEFTVYDEDGDEVFTDRIEAFNFAPQTKSNLALRWESETLDEGEYTVEGGIDAEGETFSFEREFAFEQDRQEGGSSSSDYPEIGGGDDGDDDSWFDWSYVFGSVALLFIALYIRTKMKESRRD